MNIRKATLKDQAAVIDILTESFSTNKSIRYVVKNDRRMVNRIRELMYYSFRMCMAFGEVWITDDKSGCAMFLFARKKRMKVLLDLRLALKAITIPRIFKVVKRESMIERHHPSHDFLYLWFIGVLPAAQKKGMGSKLLTNLLELAKAKSLEVYLETSTVPNLDWYENHGFEIFNKLEFDHTLYMLRKTPED